MNAAYPMALGIPEEMLGILFSAMTFASAFGAWIYSKATIKMEPNKLFSILSIIYVLSLLFTNINSVILTIVLLTIRFMLEPSINAINSKDINDSIESKYRATALSTFSIIKGMPYVILAIPLGSLIDEFGALDVTIYLGIVTLILIGLIYTIKLLLSAKQNQHI
ncbi:MAG: hypothetical protein Q9M91_07780 [Candidatus Dojkabacteria bacterium]|nr:hypothetical protein [Candidatus Dojkabacteria bacterium]MDQ7021685.1 hypothetical protein [Candidatus Dojkabacteria bacterium]